MNQQHFQWALRHWLKPARYWITGLRLARLGQEPAGNQSEHEVVRTHMLEQLKYLLADSSGFQA